jgi:hypothetical protein
MKLTISESEKNRIKSLYINEQSMGGFLSPTLQSTLHSENPPIKQTPKKSEPKEPLKTDADLKPKIQDALNELNKFGYSKELASAIVANMKFESGVNPTTLNKNDNGAPAFGLIQWRGSDVKLLPNDVLKPVKSENPSRLKKLLQKRGYDTIPVQIDFLHDELTNDTYEKKQFNKVKSGKSVKEMGKLFDEYVERSTGASREERGQYAQNIYDDINNGHYNYA